jgi:hypothetical protein
VGKRSRGRPWKTLMKTLEDDMRRGALSLKMQRTDFYRERGSMVRSDRPR